MKVNRQVSERLYNQVAGLGWGTCYDVAMAVLLLPECDGAFYLEGGVTFQDSGRNSEHGWLELNNEIIDPTWFMHDLNYRPRYRIPKARAVEMWRENDQTLPMDPGSHLVEGGDGMLILSRAVVDGQVVVLDVRKASDPPYERGTT